MLVAFAALCVVSVLVALSSYLCAVVLLLDKNGGDGVQQSQVSSSEPGPSILANNVIGPLLLEVRCSHVSGW
jgi:hypothetical protein